MPVTRGERMRAARRRSTRGTRAIVRAACAWALLPALAACYMSDADDIGDHAAALTGGDPSRAPDLMRHYGCATCHTIPGVARADGLVGPPLAGIAWRSYIGGVIPNTPDGMVRWIMDPKAIDSLTAMPNVGVSERDARDIAAYLYTLR